MNTNRCLWRCHLQGRIVSKKNSKQIIRVRGRSMLVSSKAFRQWEADTINSLKGKRPQKPITCDLELVLKLTLKDRRSEPDLSNMLEGPQDIFQKIGIIKNDKQIVRISAIKTINKDAGDFWIAELWGTSEDLNSAD